MNESTRIRIVGVLIVALLILSPVAVSLGSSPAASKTGVMQSVPGTLVVLRADPADNPYLSGLKTSYTVFSVMIASARLTTSDPFCGVGDDT